MKRCVRLIALMCLAAMGNGCLAEAGERAIMAKPYEEYMLVGAAEPEMTPNPLRNAANLDGLTERDDAAFNAWWEAWEAASGVQIPDRPAFDRFARRACQIFLGGAEAENALFSPFDLWRSMQLLAVLSGGESRSQLLGALGMDSEDALWAQADALWRSQYWYDDASACLPGAALWLDAGATVADAAASMLAQRCHASVFRGDMADPAYSDAFIAWLNGQTRGLLSEGIDALHLDSEAGFSTSTTLYFQAPWTSPFDPGATTREAFHAPGGDVEAAFMHGVRTANLYSGDGFEAVLLELEGGRRLALMLPGEGIPPAKLLEGDAAFAFLAAPDLWPEAALAQVRLALPRLDCRAALSLGDGLRAMGVKNVFDPDWADFSEAIGGEGVMALSDMLQFARLKADEQGVEAASVTVANVLGALPPQLEVDLTFDRPFVFALLGGKDVPLFVGVFNEP